MKEFLTIDEAADFLSLKKSTIYSYTHKKIIKHYKPTGRKLYFKLQDLEKFILENQILTQGEILHENLELIEEKNDRN